MSTYSGEICISDSFRGPTPVSSIVVAHKASLLDSPGLSWTLFCAFAQSLKLSSADIPWYWHVSYPLITTTLSSSFLQLHVLPIQRLLVWLTGLAIKSEQKAHWARNSSILHKSYINRQSQNLLVVETVATVPWTMGAATSECLDGRGLNRILQHTLPRRPIWRCRSADSLIKTEMAGILLILEVSSRNSLCSCKKCLILFNGPSVITSALSQIYMSHSEPKFKFFKHFCSPFCPRFLLHIWLKAANSTYALWSFFKFSLPAQLSRIPWFQSSPQDTGKTKNCVLSGVGYTCSSPTVSEGLAPRFYSPHSYAELWSSELWQESPTRFSAYSI